MTPLLEVDRVTKHFTLPDGAKLVAVNDVSLTVGERESVAIVGESGSGKTTLARTIMLLTRPSTGTIRFRGIDLLHCSRRELQRIRTRTQMVFQDPRDALDPRLRISQSVVEPLRVAEPKLSRRELAAHAAEAAELVSLDLAHLHRLPHQLSAGEQQRASLARAVVTRPDFIMLDEPTSMLDASLRAGMVQTFNELQRALGCSFLLISHDFVSVATLAHRIAVMYLGEIVESGPAERVLARPLHPYTRALLGAVPVPATQQPERAVVLSGEIPSPINRPLGCVVADRCPFAEPRAFAQRPPLLELEPGHFAACVVAAERLQRGEWEPAETPGRWLARRAAQPRENLVASERRHGVGE